MINLTDFLTLRWLRKGKTPGVKSYTAPDPTGETPARARRKRPRRAELRRVLEGTVGCPHRTPTRMDARVEGIIRAGNRVKALEHQGRNERRRARRAARLRGEVTA